MNLYNLKTNSMKNPMGINNANFSWSFKSNKEHAYQSSYRILVSKNAEMTDIVWDSGLVSSQNSLYIPYAGKPLEAQTRYFWQVSVVYDDNEIISDTEWFETGLPSEDETSWSNAKWIGKNCKSYNGYAVFEYKLNTCFKASKTGIAINARNKDNCTLLEFDLLNRKLDVFEICDNAWEPKEDAVYRKTLIETFSINASPAQFNEVEIIVTGCKLSISINSQIVCQNSEILPTVNVFQPKKDALMNIGICQGSDIALYKSLKVTDTKHNCLLKEWDFKNQPLPFGTVRDNLLEVSNCFELLNPTPSANVLRNISITKKVRSARLYATALGFYNAYINGKKVGDLYYAPGFTDYRKRVRYQCYDISEMFNFGENIFYATITKGYYTGFCNYMGPMIYGTQNFFMAKFVIDYADGSQEIIVTDDKWLYSDMGPTVESEYLDGETYDARLTLEDAVWETCGVYEWPESAKPSNGTLSNPVPFRVSPEICPAAKEKFRIKAKFITENPKGHFIYDCGQNLTGTISLTAKASKGTSIKIRYGEMCYKSGEIYVRNLRSAANTDIYTFASDRTETFVPSYTSHGFRYIEITGNGFTLLNNSIIESIEAIVIHNLDEDTSSFECSNALVNQLYSNILWGQRDNFLLVPTDCPQRNERQGWTGDMQVFAATASYNMDIKEFTRKWLVDLIDAQELYNRSGAVPDTAPLGGDNRADGCAGWGDAAIIVPWELYMAYGDKSILSDCYDMMIKWVTYQSSTERQNNGERTVNGVSAPSDLSTSPFIQVQQRRGDHLALDETTPFILSATAYAAYVSKLLSKIAEILDKPQDSEKYKKRFEDIKQAFNEAWVQEDGSIAYWGEMSKGNTDRNGNIINETHYSKTQVSQTVYALALHFDLVDNKEQTAKYLKEIVAENDNKISVGFLGIAHILYALSDAGLNDEAFNVLLNKEYPGWLYSVINGATTIWERWNSYIADTDTFGDVSMNSFNHYSYGACGEWIFKYILGIYPKDCGYKTFYLKPHFGGDLNYAKGSHNTPYGKVSLEWRVENNKFSYSCTIPANTTAYITLPDGSEYVKGSGSYNFECTI